MASSDYSQSSSQGGYGGYGGPSSQSYSQPGYGGYGPGSGSESDSSPGPYGQGYGSSYSSEKHLSMHNTSNLEVDKLQQQKTTSAFTSVSQEQKAEALMGTDSPVKMEKRSLV
ncbi:hypothetical protein PGIGA_G00041910 [Pangasianodon gigas]|uniref:Uncharacterized protein n=1 Tax=Pangasianodon gigas TaxID=30993 RepID=A0ACC5X043_PANGG|nr:hypothetical protein [Pangasianodon gigas]